MLWVRGLRVSVQLALIFSHAGGQNTTAVSCPRQGDPQFWIEGSLGSRALVETFI